MTEGSEHAADRPVRAIALMNQKGGVGKTTTAVNLAAGIARLGRRVLLVDLDPQAHASLHVGVEAGADDPTAYDLLLEPELGVAGVARSVDENLDVIPAETDLAAVESELSGAADRNRRLARALRTGGAGHEFVIFDCPPALGLLTLNALAAAHEVLVPMQAHYLALQGVGKLLETVGLMRDRVNPALRVAGVVLCMHEQQTNLSKEVVADLEGFFEAARGTDAAWASARVYRPAVRRNIKLAECPSFGQTIFQYEPGAAGAEDYAALASTLVREWDRALGSSGVSSGGSSGGSSDGSDLSDAEIRVLRGAPATPGAGSRGAGAE